MEKTKPLSGFEAMIDESFSSEGVQYNHSTSDLTDAEKAFIKNKFDETVKKDALGNIIEEEEDNIKEIVEDKDIRDGKNLEETEEEDEIEDAVNPKDDTNIEEEDKDDVEVTPENEMAIGFFGSVAEQLGYEVEEENLPKTIDEVASSFLDMIKENSKPTYANDMIREMDEFVKQGGDVMSYLQTLNDASYENITDLSDENLQKQIVTELLREKGFSDSYISKKIDRYALTDSLEEEAEDALEILKTIKAEKKEALLEQQKEAYQRAIEEEQEFVNSVIESIKELKEVHGVPVPKKDKAVLINHIFKKDLNGLSEFQKAYNADKVKNLIYSAYFTMKGDTLVNSAKQIGNNNALEKMKKNLSGNKNPKGSKKSNSSGGVSIFNAFKQTYL